MGRKCNVQDCESDSRRPEDRGVTFHKMPPHNDLRPKWISLCRIADKQKANKVIYVCSRHFLRADFCQFKGTKYFLRQGALPSVFPWALKDGQSELYNACDETLDFQIKSEIKSEPEDSSESLETREPSPSPQLTQQAPTDVDTSLQIKIEKEETEPGVDSAGAAGAEAATAPPLTNIDNFKMKADMFGAVKSEPQTQPVVKSENINSINFIAGVMIEASDFDDTWYSARIAEVDYDENEVLVRYEKCTNRSDEWIPMDSSRLRPACLQAATALPPPPPPPPHRKNEPFKVGEKCMAIWIDARKFPATITKVMGEDTYEVLFDDGYKKILKRNKISKYESQESRVVHMSPLFDPVVGSKEDRRERKRKLNVAELFSTKKRFRYEDQMLDEDRLPVEGSGGAGASPVVQADVGEEWTCRWVNGEPVGTESQLDSIDGPRRSIVVSDHRLPPGWEKHLAQRVHGTSAGKWETIIRSPEGKKFRTRADIKTYLQERNMLEYAVERFDFSLHLNRARKLGLYEVTDGTALALTPAVFGPAAVPVKAPRTPASRGSTPRAAAAGTMAVATAVPTHPCNIKETDEEEEDESHSLKIRMENDSYKCPIEGCGKNFRKENLAQMHIKHYHPEYTKFIGSTPNVADLAYARTVGESIDDIVPKGGRLSVGTVDLRPSKAGVKVLTPKLPVSTGARSDDTDLRKIERSLSVSSPVNMPRPATKDAEIIRLLNSDPKSKGIDSIFDPNPHNVPDPFKFDGPDVKALPEGAKYPDIKLKDLLYKAEPIPTLKKEEVRTGIKTLLPVIRNTDDAATADADGGRPFVRHPERARPGRKRHSSDYEGRRRRSAAMASSAIVKYDMAEEHSDMGGEGAGDSMSSSQDAASHRDAEGTGPLLMSVAHPEQPQVIIEGGEVIRLVHMRREEIINCTCGITEEDGLMIQCELCLCWQHGHCNNILRENQVPDKYVCYICTHPQRLRPSKKYMHDQDWLKHGALATAYYHSRDDRLLARRVELLRRSHELSGALIDLNEYTHNLRIKLNIAGNKDHPKLYLWAKPWDKTEPDHNIELDKFDVKDLKVEDIKAEDMNDSFTEEHSYMKSSVFGDLSLKTVLEPPPLPALQMQLKREEAEVDQKISSQSELISILEGEPSAMKGPRSVADFPKIDLNNMIADSLAKVADEEPISGCGTRSQDLESKEHELGSLTGGSLELPLTQADLDKLSTLAQMGDVVESPSVACVPQPEAAIQSSQCQMNLLNHMMHYQEAVDKRLDAIEAHIRLLESQEPDPFPEETHDNNPRTKQTLQMCIRDLHTMLQVASL